MLHRKEVIKLILTSSHDFDIKCAKPELGGGGGGKGCKQKDNNGSADF